MKQHLENNSKPQDNQAIERLRDRKIYLHLPRSSSGTLEKPETKVGFKTTLHISYESPSSYLKKLYFKNVHFDMVHFYCSFIRFSY